MNLKSAGIFKLNVDPKRSISEKSLPVMSVCENEDLFMFLV